jgi:hypothetical protein
MCCSHEGNKLVLQQKRLRTISPCSELMRAEVERRPSSRAGADPLPDGKNLGEGSSGAGQGEAQLGQASGFTAVIPPF